LAFPCFKIAKEFAKSPTDLANELAHKLTTEKNQFPDAADHQLFVSFFAVGPYVNTYIHGAIFAETVLTEILTKKADYGR
jgi:arginyl-tRNA synthetase